jgi:thioredoxin-related protein
MRFTARLALLALLVLPVLAGVAGAAPAVEWKGWNAGLSAASSSHRPVVVDVYTDWCRWCKQMDREVYGRAEVAQYLSAHFVTVKLDAESGETVSYQGRNMTARSLASSFDVSGYPTTIFLAANGEHLVNVPGYVEPAKFLLLLRYIGDGHMERGVKWEDYVKKSGGGN